MTNRDALINNLGDIFGYSADDFSEMTTQQILEYLTDDQKEQLTNYTY